MQMTVLVAVALTNEVKLRSSEQCAGGLDLAMVPVDGAINQFH